MLVIECIRMNKSLPLSCGQLSHYDIPVSIPVGSHISGNSNLAMVMNVSFHILNISMDTGITFGTQTMLVAAVSARVFVIHLRLLTMVDSWPVLYDTLFTVCCIKYIINCGHDVSSFGSTPIFRRSRLFHRIVELEASAFRTVSYSSLKISPVT